MSNQDTEQKLKSEIQKLKADLKIAKEEANSLKASLGNLVGSLGSASKTIIDKYIQEAKNLVNRTKG